MKVLNFIRWCWKECFKVARKKELPNDLFLQPQKEADAVVKYDLNTVLEAEKVNADLERFDKIIDRGVKFSISSDDLFYDLADVTAKEIDFLVKNKDCLLCILQIDSLLKKPQFNHFQFTIDYYKKLIALFAAKGIVIGGLESQALKETVRKWFSIC